MDQIGKQRGVNTAELAELLLDDSFATESRRAVGLFENAGDWVEESFRADAPAIIPAPLAMAPARDASSFSVAGRLARDNSSDQLKAEALLSAIRKLRQRPLPEQAQQKNTSSGRVIKSS